VATPRQPYVQPGSPSPGRAWPRRIGILNDYVRIPYANGSSFASQFLYREFVRRGHEVHVVGPRDPDAQPHELPKHHLCLPSLPMRNHPGLYFPLPSRKSLAQAESLGLDIALGQTGTELLDLGVWLRWRQNVPFISVNTVHLPSVFNVLLPDALNNSAHITGLFRDRIIPAIERHSAAVYNQGDGLIVLSAGLRDYWRERGVTVPIFVIPRSVDPAIFDRTPSPDPFPAVAKRGQRLLCVCRQTREKGVDRLLEIFAEHVARAMPEATLTLVGDGPDYDSFVDTAKRLGIEERVFFMGERALTDIPNFYRHADLFVFASLSETYGQVVSEAMWCGLPIVAMNDGRGVAQQVQQGVSGVLVSPGPNEQQANWRFGHEVVALLRNNARRQALAADAGRIVRIRANPERCVERYYDAFEQARDHCRATEPARRAEPLQPLAAIARWSVLQLTAVAFGLLRPPALVNRRGQRQPVWDTPSDWNEAEIPRGLKKALTRLGA